MDCVTEAPQHVLLAEDDDDDRFFFIEALQSFSPSIKLTVARNGEQLMELLQEFSQFPDFLFLDLNMPRKSGLECLEEIKQNKLLKDVPIFVLSTSNQPTFIERAYNEGAWLYIRKPNDFETLKKIVHHVLSMDWKISPQQLSREEFVLGLPL